MKLPSPFFRLPVRFDVERLRAEVESLPADVWSRHPQEYQGNTAARLITAGGTQNDSVAGAMQPTPALLASPYLQQVLASFNTVWSRSRLMRIDGGGSVPLHSDTNHHWYHRVRVHIPVVTRPEVRFYCGDQNVHMAAGEAWVFDNWRVHRVLNPSPEARIHLVADTTGTAAFWRLVTQGQSENFERPHPNSRLIAFDPTSRPALMIERFNVWPLMPPSEVEQLAFDLLPDLAPVDERPESGAAVSTFVVAVLEFCHNWRSLWHLHGDVPEARSQFENLAEVVRRNLRQLPPVRVASTGNLAMKVVQSRILSMLFGGAGGSRQEATEFSVTSSISESAAGIARDSSLQSPVGPSPSGPERQGSPAPGKPPVIDRPLIIVSAPRAGSTLLFETLAQASGVYTIGGESHSVIEGINALRPGRGTVTSNRLTRKDATVAIAEELRNRFATKLRDRDGLPPAPGSRARFLEKTPKNALRVPFLLEVFPDASFVYLRREPRANLSSMIEAWRAQKWVTYRQLAGWNGAWSLLLPPGYERLQGRPLEEIVAFQWRAANETILDDLADVPRERWTTVHYEDLVRDPRSEIVKILDFAGLALDPRFEEYLSKPLPPSRHTHTKPDPDKWKRNAAAIERVLPQLEALRTRLEA